jgi:hypothetical protein
MNRPKPVVTSLKQTSSCIVHQFTDFDSILHIDIMFNTRVEKDTK